MEKLFDQWIEAAKATGISSKIAVVAAHDEHTLEAVFSAQESGLITPILIGDESKIKNILSSLDKADKEYEIINITDKEEAAKYAASLANHGICSSIMKGKLETGELMKVLVNKDFGVRGDGAMSLIGFYESPYYHKIFAVTDMGLLMYPNLQQKADEIRNAVHALRKLGITKPKVAVLSAVEKVNPKMPECIDAAELKDMNQRGVIEGCIIEGPISYDLAMDPHAASIKGYESTVAGDADLLVVPNITCGNILVKALTCTGGAQTCGVVLGAKVPLVLTSRSAAARDKYLSIILASLIGQNA